MSTFSLSNVAVKVMSTTSRQKSGGFTLLELLVVIVIIGLLAAYVGPKYFAQLGKSEIAVTRSQIESFEKALDNFRVDVGRYPTTEEGLASLMISGGAIPKWNGPYLRKKLKDPWGNDYQYRSPGMKYEYEILSFVKMGSQAAQVKMPIFQINSKRYAIPCKSCRLKILLAN
jgi:general secretion pathway protein G